VEPDWLNLLREQAAIRRDPWVVLEGQAALEAALAGWWEVTGVAIDEAHPWEVPSWSGLEVTRLRSGELETLADPSRHRGVLGLARIPAESSEVATFCRALEEGALLVVCPKLIDPEFAGCLTRLAEAVGAAGVLFGTEGASPFGALAVAASGGSLFRLPVRVADGGVILRSLKSAGVDLTGWEAGNVSVATSPPAGRRALVVGDPEAGLGPFWRAACDRRAGGGIGELLASLAVKAD
jgi:TrmH family RNA methyltransferase